MPELRDAIRKVNVEPPTVACRQAFTKPLESDLAVWRKIVESGNIKPE